MALYLAIRDNDYREFDKADVKRIKRIQIYLEPGMSMKEIHGILNCFGNYDDYDDDEFCEEMIGVYQEKHTEIVHQIQTMTTVKQKLEQRIERMRVRRKMMSTVIGTADQSNKTI